MTPRCDGIGWERLAAFRRSSPSVQGERESAAALIASAGGEKRGQNTSKNTSEGETDERVCEGGG